MVDRNNLCGEFTFVLGLSCFLQRLSLLKYDYNLDGCADGVIDFSFHRIILIWFRKISTLDMNNSPK